MKNFGFREALLLSMGGLIWAISSAQAQSVGSSFTYQGELRQAGTPANGTFDFQFRLFSTPNGGVQIGPDVTVSAAVVTEGIFFTELDFGPAQFAGDAQWLEIAVGPAGSGIFDTLAPRTAVSAAPYALGAVTALADSVTDLSIIDGSVGAADVDAGQVQRRVSGNCASSQAIQSITQAGTVVCGELGTGTLTGLTAGSGLSGGGDSGFVTLGIAAAGVGSAQINPSQVQARVTGSCTSSQAIQSITQEGSVECADLPSGTLTGLTAGSGLSGGGTSGTVSVAIAPAGVGSIQINDAQVQTRVTGTCSVGQYVRQVNQDGSVTCGADATGTPGWQLSGNSGTSASDFLGTSDARSMVIGVQNQPVATFEPSSAVLFGGLPITANVIAGSSANNVTSGVRGATISGGGVMEGDTDPIYSDEGPNRVTDHFGSISGGYANLAGDGDAITGSSPFTTVGGGLGNKASLSYATVSGGQFNTANNFNGFVGGGFRNTASARSSVVSGGSNNLADGPETSIGGGSSNQASGDNARVGGGILNMATGTRSTIAGGEGNAALGSYGTIGGGINNSSEGFISTTGGGQDNMSSGRHSTVGGGWQNTANSEFAVVSGGWRNCAGGVNSWAGGTRALVRPGSSSGDTGVGCFGVFSSGDADGDNGTFVWADTQGISFQSTGPNQFLVRAGGGVGINTNSPGSGNALRVAGGRVRIEVLGTAGSSALCRNSQNQISGCSSSARYKTDIADLGLGLETASLLRPVSYRWTATGEEDLGFVAEEIAEIDSRLVTRNPDGQIEGVKYERVSAVLAGAVQDLATGQKRQSKTLEKLAAENAALRQQLSAVSRQLKLLTTTMESSGLYGSPTKLAEVSDP